MFVCVSAFVSGVVDCVDVYCVCLFVAVCVLIVFVVRVFVVL